MTDTYENLIKVGVIDPAKVVRSALQNASSIASLLLTNDILRRLLDLFGSPRPCIDKYVRLVFGYEPVWRGPSGTRRE